MTAGVSVEEVLTIAKHPWVLFGKEGGHAETKFLHWLLWRDKDEDRLAAAERLANLTEEEVQAALAQYRLEEGV